jgi:hypothetical protein
MVIYLYPMEKPKRPGKNAGTGAWERYHDEMALWKQYQRQQHAEQTGPRHVQYRDNDTVAKVQSAYSVDHGVPTSDFIIADRNKPGHLHVVYDEDGNEIVNHWVEGR